MKKYKIGDYIRIMPKYSDSIWYTDELFQIIGINEKPELYKISIKLNVMINSTTSTIYFGNVYQDSGCLKMMRKKKIEKIKWT